MLGWCWPIFYDAGPKPVKHVFAGQVLAPRNRYVSFCGPRAVALPGKPGQFHLWSGRGQRP